MSRSMYSRVVRNSSTKTSIGLLLAEGVDPAFRVLGALKTGDDRHVVRNKEFN